MLSKRSYTIFRLLNISHLLGITSLSFDTERLLLKNDTSPTSRNYKTLKRAHSLTLFWNINTLFAVFKLYLLGDMEFYITWAFWLVGSLVNIMFSISFLFSQELCELANLVLVFLRYFHSKNAQPICLSFSSISSMLALFGI